MPTVTHGGSESACPPAPRRLHQRQSAEPEKHSGSDCGSQSERPPAWPSDSDGDVIAEALLNHDCSGIGIPGRITRAPPCTAAHVMITYSRGEKRDDDFGQCPFRSSGAGGAT